MDGPGFHYVSEINQTYPVEKKSALSELANSYLYYKLQIPVNDISKVKEK